LKRLTNYHRFCKTMDDNAKDGSMSVGGGFKVIEEKEKSQQQ
jgi:hypothetical protein